ncbi:MAG: ATP-dependent Clp protease adapter ClpS [Myxococcales bacterium]|nr:ATP-dependent Clp protease adapter ClpS [Myxococcales bacterium]
MPGSDHDRQDGVLISTRKKVKRPPMYNVVLHNDDYTTQEFVVQILKAWFNRTDTDARQVMLTVHHKGQGIAGTYTRDMAESKVAKVTEHARGNGMPLKLTVERA